MATIVRAAGSGASPVASAVYRADAAGVVGDWTGGVGGSGTNDTATVQALINAVPAGATIQFTPSKTYRLDNLVITKPLVLDGNGASIVASPFAGSAPLLWFKGSVGAARTINTATVSGTTVTVTTAAQAADFTVGDYVAVGDNKVLPRYDGTTSVNTGRMEVTRVASVNTSTGVVGLEKPLEFGYDTTPFIQKITMVRQPVVKGFASITEIDPGTTWSGTLHGAVPHIVHFQYCVQPVASQLTVTRFNSHAVNFHACVGPVVEHCTAADPYRASSGGHGYLMRFDQCTGGVARENISHGVRHHANWVNAFDCASQGNTAYGCVVSAYQTHGIWSARAASRGDTAIGGGFGWSFGNPEFAGDTDMTISSPRYVGVSTAIVARTKSVRLTVENPDIHTTLRGLHQCEGADKVTVTGGTIEILGSDASSVAVLVRSRLASGDTLVASPGDITIRGLRCAGATQPLLIDSVGIIDVDGVRFDNPAMTTSGAALMRIGVDEGLTPTGLRVTRVNGTTGAYRAGIRVGTAPSGGLYVLDGNTVPLSSDAAAGIIAPVANTLRAAFNRTGTGGIALSGDAAAARTAGAAITRNFPATYDG